MNLENLADLSGQILKGITNAEAWGNVNKILHTNEAITKDVTKDAIEKSKGIAGTILRYKGDNQDLKKAIRNAYSENGLGKGWDAGAIAGSYIGASAGYRVLSGGGLYRDNQGNTNIIGIPFV